MLATPRVKWLTSIVLAGVLLVLSMMGGQWGLNYSAKAGVNFNPIIYWINPIKVAAGSPRTLMIVNGANFGDLTDTALRIKGLNTVADDILTPLFVASNGMSVWVDASYLVNPNTSYLISVVMSTVHTTPTVPVSPWDVESNPKAFDVYQPLFSFLPIIRK